MNLKNTDFVVNYPDEDFYVHVPPSGEWSIKVGEYDPGRDHFVSNTERYLKSTKANNSFTSEVVLVVFITEQCNMRCSYCKYDNVITKDTKDIPLIDNITSSISAFAKNYDRVNLTFFGASTKA